MMAGDPGREPAPLASIRTILLGALILGVLGTGGELILLGHVDEPAQWIPVVLLAVALPLLLWHARSPSAGSARALQVLVALFVAVGVIGIGLHFDGNAEFEQELHPTSRGFERFRATAAGATPVLAPGSLILLGLVGLAHTYQHPALTPARNQEKQL